MTQTITVVVPCYPPHQKYIPRILEQLNKQSIKPDEIIVALSEVTVEETLSQLKEWSQLTDIPLQVVGQPIKALAAVNRNFGALHATTDYIVFLDADDQYHIKLIETLKKYIEFLKPDAILYHLSESELTDDIESHKFYSSSELFKNVFPDSKFNELNEEYNRNPQLELPTPIHHGHICVKYESWLEFPQEDLINREDAVWIRKLLWNWHADDCKTEGVIVIPEILTYYKKNELK